MSSVSIVSNQIIVLVILMMTGFLLSRFHLIDEAATRGFSTVLLKVATPCALLLSLQGSYPREVLIKGFVIFVLVALVMLLGCLLGIVCARLFRIKEPDWRIWAVGGMLSNTMFMGMPMIRALHPGEGEFYLAFGNMAFNFISFSIAYRLFLKKGAQAPKSIGGNIVDVLKTPCIIACFVGIFLYIFSIELPELILSPIQYLANAMVPLSMIILGALVSRNSLGKLVLDWRIYLLAFLRLLLLPVAVYFIFGRIIGDKVVLDVLVYAVAMPIATTTAIFAEEYGDCGERAAGYTIASTVLSVLTIPVISLILG